MDSSPELTPYELMVQRNIEANRQVLKSLGLLEPVKELKVNQQRRPRKSSNPRQITQNGEIKVENLIPAKRTRRSFSILKSLGYDEFDEAPNIFNNAENMPPIKKERVVREQVFGEIEGVNVGDWWQTRMECSSAGVHRPTVAGIHGKLGAGCYSIALSGGYEDDVDYGECFTYTGCGGRDLKGTKTNPKNLRTAPQSKDQVMDGTNAALASNIEKKIPVRVIRGFKLQSQYAPQEGYRYDGLYSVEKCWIASGLSGFKVCKFALKRLPDQDPPPWKTHPSILSPEKERLVVTPTRRTLVPKLELSPDQNSLEKTHVSTINALNSAKDSEKEKTPTCSPLGFVKVENTTDAKIKGTDEHSSDSKVTDLSKETSKVDQEEKTLSSIEDFKSTPEKKKENDIINRVIRVTRLSIGTAREERKSEELHTSNWVRMNEGNTRIDSELTISPVGLSGIEETNSITPSSTNLPKTNNPSAKKRKENDNLPLKIKVTEISNEVTKTDQNNKSLFRNEMKKSPTLTLNAIPVPKKNSNEVEGYTDNDSELEENFLGFPEFQNTKQTAETNINVEDFIDRFEVEITPDKKKQSSRLKPNHVEKSRQESKDFGTPSNSCEKKVRFSPKVCYTDDEGNVEFFLNCCSGESTDKITDRKKQTSILNYFEPMKKNVEVQPAKPVVNPKSLRGNRFTSFSLVTYSDVRPKSEKSCSSSKKNSFLRVSEGETVPNGGFLESTRSTSGNRRKSWSQKRKYSSFDNNRESYLDVELNLSKQGPSMMENLIKQNNDKLRLHNQRKKRSKKRKMSYPTSPVKPCFVSLLRLEEIFLGWDMGDVSVFHGFSERDKTANQQRTDRLKKVYKTVYDSQWSLKWLHPDPSKKDSFHGWNEDFRGARGLVPIGFIINKLSES